MVQLLEQVRLGHGQIAFVTGEAGIGKSRFVAEVKRLSTAAPFVILHANCLELDRSAAYAPMIDLLRHVYVTAEREGRALLQSYAANLGTLLPELDRDTSNHPFQTQTDPQQGKPLLHHNLMQFLRQYTRLSRKDADAAAMILVVEDLHWCDESTLEFLERFAQRLAQEPILLLVTYRADERHPSLVRFLSQLNRTRITHEFALPRFDIAQTLAAMRAIFRLPAIRSEFVEALQSLTDGNPFFIEEILKSLVSVGDIFYSNGTWNRKALGEMHIPRTLGDAVERRTLQLSTEAHRVLTLAAVVGRHCPFTILQQLTQTDTATLLTWLKELIADQLIAEEAPNLFSFRHALTQQVIYNSLLTHERRMLHAEVLAALEQAAAVGQSISVAELAHHAYESADQAGTWEKALSYAQHAGEQALSVYAPQAVLAHVDHATIASTQLRQSISWRLHYLRGQAKVLLSDFSGAHVAYSAALAQARAVDDRTAQWQCLIDLGILAQESNFEQAGAYFQEAHAVAVALQDESKRAITLNWLGRWYSMMDEPAQACQAQTEALRIFQHRGDREGIATTFSLLGWSNYVAADLQASIDAYQQAISLCQETGQRLWLIFSLAGLSMRGRDYFNLASVWPSADLANCLQDADEAVRTAQAIGYRSGEARALIWQALGLGPCGEYGRAFACLRAALEITEEDEQPRYIATAYCALGALYCDLLDLATARRHLEQSVAISSTIHSPTVHRVAIGWLASTAIGQGDLTTAQALLDGALPDHLTIDSKARRLLGCSRAELLLAQHEATTALSLIDRLIAGAPPSHIDKTDAEPTTPAIPRLLSLRGEAFAALGRYDEAEQMFLAALQAANAQGARPQIWRIQTQLARTYQRLRRRDQVQAAILAAKAAIDELSLTIEEAEVRRNFVQAAHAQLPTVTPLTALRTAKQAFGGLTAREREIVVHIVQGQSNREIAASLVISERTVAKHVENILAKFQFATRTQIAVWGASSGLMTQADEDR
jgi:tetratricopeptide (TPR) repeat protein